MYVYTNCTLGAGLALGGTRDSVDRREQAQRRSGAPSKLKAAVTSRSARYSRDLRQIRLIPKKKKRPSW